MSGRQIAVISQWLSVMGRPGHEYAAKAAIRIQRSMVRRQIDLNPPFRKEEGRERELHVLSETQSLSNVERSKDLCAAAPNE